MSEFNGWDFTWVYFFSPKTIIFFFSKVSQRCKTHIIFDLIDKKHIKLGIFFIHWIAFYFSPPPHTKKSFFLIFFLYLVILLLIIQTSNTFLKLLYFLIYSSFYSNVSIIWRLYLIYFLGYKTLMNTPKRYFFGGVVPVRTGNF